MCIRDRYGADDFLLNSMDIIEGEIDWEALRTGKYPLYALTMDDNGNVIDNPSIPVSYTHLDVYKRQGHGEGHFYHRQSVTQAGAA